MSYRSRAVRLTVACAAFIIIVTGGTPAGAQLPVRILDRFAPPEALATASTTAENLLGPAFAGAWIDTATGLLNVGTTDANLFAAIRLIGAVPRQMENSAAALAAVQAVLDARVDVPPTVAGWYVDLPDNAVVVEVVGGDPAGLEFAAMANVVVHHVEEQHTPYWDIIGGQAITTGGSRCSAGFNARSAGGVRYVLTAGHCTNIGTTWSGTGGALGTTAGSSFPTNDYGIVRVTSTSAISTPLVDRYASGSDLTVTGAGNAIVGQNVCRSGSTTGYRCGVVTALNQTVNYGGGQTVSGLVRTNACAQPGDSGGSFVSAPLTSTRVQGLGMTSGGSGNCSTGGTTFFQPVTEALSVYGLTLYTG